VTAEYIGGDGTVERSRRRRLVITVLVVVDFIALMLATQLASWIRFDSPNAPVGFVHISEHIDYYQVSWALVAIWLVAIAFEHLYDLERLTWGKGEFSRIVRALALGVVAFILLTYAIKANGLSRAWTLLAFALAVGAVSLGRLLVRGGLRWRRKRGRLQRRTLIVGSNAEARAIIRTLAKRPDTGLLPVGCLGTSHSVQLNLDYCSDLVPSLGVARDLVDIVVERGIDTVIMVASAFDSDVVARMIAELRGVDVSIHVSSGLIDVLTSRVLVREVAGIPLITVRGVSLSRGNLLVKRLFDVTVASAIIVLGVPLWVLIALAIKLDSRGPVFYRQERVGQDGEPFGMYKFRSMCADADARLEQLKGENEATGPLFKMKRDPRVTRVGRVLRKFSIDEFPQLLNVLAGDMSLVGPRPPLPPETAAYGDHEWRRMEVPPGMTGLWQVSGRSSLTFDEMVHLDLFYIENWSVAFDVALLFRTIPAVLLAKGAY
jgi:exopolysaccharide biosynthesis polyprenyl glycosylphosphotransferase